VGASRQEMSLNISYLANHTRGTCTSGRIADRSKRRRGLGTSIDKSEAENLANPLLCSLTILLLK